MFMRRYMRGHGKENSFSSGRWLIGESGDEPRVSKAGGPAGEAQQAD